MKNLLYYIKHPNRLIKITRLLALEKVFGKKMSDEAFLKKKFKLVMGQPLSLDNPKTYNEKLQWLKLYDRQPIYTEYVDKYLVRSHIAKQIGEEYLIPLIGGPWVNFDEIDFETLPNQFVLKCTHDSGGLVICKDKSKLDLAKAKKLLESRLKQNFYDVSREWPYKNVKPRIIAEQYMEDESGTELKDYKFFCFDGVVKAMFVATDRPKATKFNFYDENFNFLPFTNGHPNSTKEIKKPQGFEGMKRIAGILSQGIPHVRVDLYNINGKILFGELTFYHCSGFTPFVPSEWDEKFGEWINLPKKIKKETIK